MPIQRDDLIIGLMRWWMVLPEPDARLAIVITRWINARNADGWERRPTGLAPGESIHVRYGAKGIALLARTPGGLAPQPQLDYPCAYFRVPDASTSHHPVHSFLP